MRHICAVVIVESFLKKTKPRIAGLRGLFLQGILPSLEDEVGGNSAQRDYAEQDDCRTDHDYLFSFCWHGFLPPQADMANVRLT